MLELIPVGHSTKSRGVHGNFKANISKKFVPDVLKAKAIFIKLKGSKVPFLIESAEDHGHLLMKLEEVDSPEAVSAYLSKELFLDADEISLENKSEAKETNVLVGYSIIDQNDNVIGDIIEILEYPEQILAKLFYNNKQVLVPIHEDLVIELAEDSKKLKLEIAEGLLEL